jgi:hypothetical protein
MMQQPGGSMFFRVIFTPFLNSDPFPVHQDAVSDDDQLPDALPGTFCAVKKTKSSPYSSRSNLYKGWGSQGVCKGLFCPHHEQKIGGRMGA